MIRIRFPTSESERKAIGFLGGRFSFKTFAEGYSLVPRLALSSLAGQGIVFTVEGLAAYEERIPTVRDSSLELDP